MMIEVMFFVYFYKDWIILPPVEREMLFDPVSDIDACMETTPMSLDVTASVIMNDYVDEYSGIPMQT